MSFHLSLNFSDQLKSQTLALHQNLEKLLMQKMRSVNSVQDYLQILSWFYSFFGGLEILVDNFIRSSELEDYLQRRKASNLKNDILSFKGTCPELASGMELPLIQNWEEALGALYVMEGSTLGGPIIAGFMRRQLDWAGKEGFSFFECYGDNTQAMWLRFKSALDSKITSDEQKQCVIRVADDTFGKFERFIVNNRYINTL